MRTNNSTVEIEDSYLEQHFNGIKSSINQNHIG